MKSKRKENSNRFYTPISAILLISILGVAYGYLNYGYPEVSEQGFEYGMALMSACNRQDQARVDIIANGVTRDLNEKRLPQSDAEVLLQIIRLANASDWKAAIEESRKLLDAQVDSKLAMQK